MTQVPVKTRDNLFISMIRIKVFIMLQLLNMSDLLTKIKQCDIKTYLILNSYFHANLQKCQQKFKNRILI